MTITHNSKLFRSVALVLFPVVLSACGGGGSSAPATSGPSAEGVYQGTSSNGNTFNAVVLEDGSIWALYGVVSVNALFVNGVFTGNGSSNNGSYSASTKDFPVPGNAAITGTLTATYTAGSTLLGTLREGSTTLTLTGAVPVSSTYNYSSAANLASVTGNWSGGLLDGETATITVASNGSLTGLSSLGCSFTGSITPRASGKNVFNTTITFGASPCVLPGQSASGVALVYPLAGGGTQLIAGATNGSSATAFFAQR